MTSVYPYFFATKKAGEILTDLRLQVLRKLMQPSNPSLP